MVLLVHVHLPVIWGRTDVRPNWVYSKELGNSLPKRGPRLLQAASEAYGGEAVASSVSTAMARKVAGPTAVSNLPEAMRRRKRPSGSSLTIPITEL